MIVSPCHPNDTGTWNLDMHPASPEDSAAPSACFAVMLACSALTPDEKLVRVFLMQQGASGGQGLKIWHVWLAWLWVRLLW